MPIAFENGGVSCKLIEERFRNEDELQAYLERSPYLLVAESEPRVVTVQREVMLPAAGSLDLLLVDAEGVPVAVEVKLGRNSQARREVVAQAFDYVSALTSLTVDELDDAVDGALINALEDLSSEGSNVDLRKLCGTNLRAGRIKVIVAVDEPNEGLLRIIRYVNEHSDLDVRLVSISKFDDGRLLVPRILVSGAISNLSTSKISSLSKIENAYFDKVINFYNNNSQESLQTIGHGRHYRQIRPDKWPSAVHYEFLNTQDEICIELHLESDDVRPLGFELAKMDGIELLPDLFLQWDPNWSRKRGRLVARLAKDAPIQTIAKTMTTMIEKTRSIVEKKLLRI